MSVEQIRGCGYRKVNALYLVGSYTSMPCDRMPFPLTTCPACGQGIRVSRGFTEINPYQLFGRHDYSECNDKLHPCFLCDPQRQPAYIMLVGEKYYKTPLDFLDEAETQGISKRIPFIPKDLVLGETIVYLAHNKACEVKVAPALQEAMALVEENQSKQPRLLETERNEKRLGVFAAFIPQRVEKLCYQSEYTPESIEKHKKRGIELVPVPDNDPDHK